jgi:hypothetical protein
LHPPSGERFAFPQHNGDVFAFDSEVNRRFQHGVPKLSSNVNCGPRFSVIAWGRRRSINERNGGKKGENIPNRAANENEFETTSEGQCYQESKQDSQVNHKQVVPSESIPQQKSSQESMPAMGIEEVTKLVESFVLNHGQNSQQGCLREGNCSRPNVRGNLAGKNNIGVSSRGGIASAGNSNSTIDVNQSVRVQGGWGSKSHVPNTVHASKGESVATVYSVSDRGRGRGRGSGTSAGGTGRGRGALLLQLQQQVISNNHTMSTNDNLDD